MNAIMSDAERELRAECLALRSRVEEQAYELREMREYVAERDAKMRDRLEGAITHMYVAFVVTLAAIAGAHLLLS